MAPVVYGDLGKSAKDVFGKGYHFNLMKLEVKTTNTGWTITNTGHNLNNKSGTALITNDQ